MAEKMQVCEVLTVDGRRSYKCSINPDVYGPYPGTRRNTVHGGHTDGHTVVFGVPLV